MYISLLNLHLHIREKIRVHIAFCIALHNVVQCAKYLTSQYIFRFSSQSWRWVRALNILHFTSPIKSNSSCICAACSRCKWVSGAWVAGARSLVRWDQRWRVMVCVSPCPPGHIACRSVWPSASGSLQTHQMMISSVWLTNENSLQPSLWSER